jgi:hypothetical protein
MLSFPTLDLTDSSLIDADIVGDLLLRPPSSATLASQLPAQRDDEGGREANGLGA